MTDAYPSFHHGIPYQYEIDRNRFGREQEVLNRRTYPREEWTQGTSGMKEEDKGSYGPTSRIGKEGDYCTAEYSRARNLGCRRDPYWQEDYTFAPIRTTERFGRDRDMEKMKEPTSEGQIWKPRVDMFETGKGKLVCEFEMPGVPLDHLKINMDPDTLEVWTTKPRGALREDAMNYYICERHFGNYHRKLELPFRVDPSRASAIFENGVLKVTSFAVRERFSVEIPVLQR